jgi:hypothetical protein
LPIYFLRFTRIPQQSGKTKNFAEKVTNVMNFPAANRRVSVSVAQFDRRRINKQEKYPCFFKPKKADIL